MGWQDDPVVGGEKRPPVDQSVMDPRDAQAKAPLRLGQYAARLPGVPASVTQSVDQWYGRNAGELRQQEADATSGLTQRFLRGFAQDPIVGTAQLAANLTPAGDAVNSAVRADEARYQQSRAMGGSNGVDIARGVGTAAAVAAPLNKVTPLGTGSWMARAGNAAVQGAAAGATMPVTEGRDYWTEKAKQVGTTAAVSGALSGPLELVVRGAAGLLNLGVRGVAAVRERLARASDSDIDAAVQAALDQHSPGIKLSDMAEQVKAKLREQVRAQGDLSNLKPQEVARVADMTAAGVTATRAKATRDPALWSREQNLARMGANSDDPALQALAQAKARDNAALIESASKHTAGAPDAYGAGQAAVGAVQKIDEQARAAITALYNRARGLNGGDIPLDARQSVQQVFRELELEGKLPFLGEHGAVLNKIVSGEFPLTVGTAEGLKSTLANGIKSATDGNVKIALRKAYDAIENAAPAGQVGADAMAAFRQARNAAKARFDLIDKSPAYKAVVEGIEPDQFVQRFIIGQGAAVSDVMTLRTALTRDPQAFGAVRSHLANWIKQKALNGASDETAVFSQSAYNKALDAIGDRKLAAFFSPQEIAQLRQVGRAAAYAQKEPAGAAVNYSNSGTLVAAQANNLLQRIANSPITNAIIGMVPGGGFARDAARGAARSVSNTRAQDAARAEANNLLAPLGIAQPPSAVDANALIKYIGPASVGGAFALNPSGNR